MKKHLKSALITFLCLAVFGSTAYLYIAGQKTVEMNKNESKIPYSRTEQNLNILCQLPRSRIMLQFDFQSGILTATRNCETGNFKNYFTVTGDEAFVSGIIDRVGGVETETQDGKIRYTGVQATDILYNSSCEENTEISILKAFLNNAVSGGFSRSDCVYLIENSKTDIKLPDILNLPQTISRCENIIIN